MKPLIKHTGALVPFTAAHIDTDQIVPARFLHRSRQTGFGDVLFHDLRFASDGSERTEFILNQACYSDGSILIAGPNFGCGSSREHAVWALLDYGFRVVIAPSFGDIFFNNSLKNGVLAIAANQALVDTLAEEASRAPGAQAEVDLQNQTICWGKGTNYTFEIDPYRKGALIDGASEIEMTLRLLSEIELFEQEHLKRRPWMAGVKFS